MQLGNIYRQEVAHALSGEFFSILTADLEMPNAEDDFSLVVVGGRSFLTVLPADAALSEIAAYVHYLGENGVSLVESRHSFRDGIKMAKAESLVSRRLDPEGFIVRDSIFG